MTARLRAIVRAFPFPEVDGEDALPLLLTVEGQAARTLLHAIQAGPKGFTSLEISTWALRTSHYVFVLRGLGLEITMDREDHDSVAGPGWHGRYRLLNRVEVVEVKNPDRAVSGAEVAA